MRTIARIVLLSVLFTVTLALLTLFFLQRYLPTDAEQAASPPPYTIGAWEGYVAVFEEDDPYPMQILDTAIAGLPPEQRAQVEKGVPVTRTEDLYLILEDYTN